MSATMAPVQAINVLDPMRLRQRAQRPTPTPSHRRTRQHAKSPLSRSETPSTDDRPADALSMDEDALLDLCDSVRASLRDSQTLGARASHVSKILHSFLEAENQSIPLVDAAIIRHACLDKLLADIIATPRSPPAAEGVPSPLSLDVTTAQRLKKAWETRFRDDYFSMDDARLRSLQRGRLKDVDHAVQQKDQFERYIARASCSDSAVADFEPGHWWLNLACAHRDGIVGNAHERPTKDRYGVAALPLLTGTEEHLGGNMHRYCREGKLSDMHFSLMSQVGTQIRLLRGYRLKSLYAPAAGLRYDGVFVIRAYSTKRDTVSEKHRLELTLERLPGQTPMAEVLAVPRPSQLDDWALYETCEAETTRRRMGPRSFME
ncbi:hypothetical protein HYQ45_009827 [Verticillium longisporum]|uniref:YDG domain-containing protein n=1 Tax=Verticillium longisporum TaxID=100787 RepID=A0A8I2ZHT9_VERLO|nr:hypothetical protein HYQ45_009827 [Verticillium longisporum]